MNKIISHGNWFACEVGGDREKQEAGPAFAHADVLATRRSPELNLLDTNYSTDYCTYSAVGGPTVSQHPAKQLDLMVVDLSLACTPELQRGR